MPTVRNSSHKNLPKLITGWTFLWKPFMASSQIGGGGAAGTEFFR
jgi:hypothetical protein